MDQERERIQDDLRGLLAGDVRCDDLFLQLYASDASIYEIKPLAVVRPRNTRDVVTCVEYAADSGLRRFQCLASVYRRIGPNPALMASHLSLSMLVFFRKAKSVRGITQWDSWPRFAGRA